MIFLVEEPSTEAFLRAFLPRFLTGDQTFAVHPFQGKSDLLRNLEPRLRGYSKWIRNDARIFVVVDRDNEACLVLKNALEQIAERVNLRTPSKGDRGTWQIVNRIAVEELEAWYFGDWEAVVTAFPRVPTAVANKRSFRDSDAILGGTWEAFERVLRRYGYFKGGLRKIEAARLIGTHLDPKRNASASFVVLWRAILDASN